MPARIASSHDRQQATAPSSKSKTGRGPRNSPAISGPDEGTDSELRSQVCNVFAEAQRSTVQHRKQITILRRIHESCFVTRKDGHLNEKDFDENDFSRELGRCLIRVLTIRKSEAAGDRIIRFFGTYLSTSNQKDNGAIQSSNSSSGTLETPTSRLVSYILGVLIPFLDVKDKTVRFRSTQITSHIINSMDTLDDQMFYTLRTVLLRRTHDKEAPVRLQAVYGLGRLAAEIEDEHQEQSDSDVESNQGGGVLGKLLNVLQNDPSCEVRRNLLLNLPLTKEVLPFLLERARDEDATTRRALYSRLLPGLGDFRLLSLTHREKLLRWGLRDRDETVRKATAKLFRERWIEDCAALPTVKRDVRGGDSNDDLERQTGGDTAAPSLDALLELLERIDVINSGVEGGIALLAMHEFWQGRPDYVDYVSFPDQFWSELSPELSFVARTYNDFCRQSKQVRLETLLEERLPEVTKFAFLLQRELRRLIELINAEATDLEVEEESVQREFIVEQMLHMALTFDYGDEVGRQKMFSLMREALATPDLPEETTRLAVETLRLVCGDDARGEKEFCGVVLEAIAEVHDTIMTDENEDLTNSSIDESFHSANSQVGRSVPPNGYEAGKPKGMKGNVSDLDSREEQAIREIVINMKCLHIALCMLQNIQCDLEENIHLVTMLNNLIVPAVRSQESPIRERGLCCLGLCCLLGKKLATENLSLFLHCFNKGNASLQATALQIICDIIITHPSLLVAEETREDGSVDVSSLQKQVLKAFNKSLKSSDAGIQSTGATALAKTMLSRIITDTDLLKQLVIAYFDPQTATNVQLRQSLAYFLPVYCQSNADNARRIAGMVPSVISRLATLRDAYMDDAEATSGMETSGSDVVNLNTAGQMLLDWTDPRNSIAARDASDEVDDAKYANDMHFSIAQSTFEVLCHGQLSKDVKKALLGMLGKVYLPCSGGDSEVVSTLLRYVAEGLDSGLAPDATSRNILGKLQTQLMKCAQDRMSAERNEGAINDISRQSTTISEPSQHSSSADNASSHARLSGTTLDTGTTTMSLTSPDAKGARMSSIEDNEGSLENTNDTMDTFT